MKITDIKIDGFGVWHDLELNKLSPRTTAFFGANEAGKTTLMQFVRSIMYGMSAERRSRYLPPVNGGNPGGVLGIIDRQEPFAVSRIADRGPEDIGLVTVTDQEGKETGDRILRDALADVDERTYNNIFAIGLREIQELGTLSDNQSAEWLYRLTSGLDRVSLYDVIQNLRQTRHDLLTEDDHNSKLIHLQDQRESLRGEILQLKQQGRQWAELAIRIEELSAEIQSQEETVRQLEHGARTIEIAVNLKPNWRKRAKIASQLQQASGGIVLPDDAVQRLDDLNQRVETHQREADILEGQRRQLREDSEQLGINELLVKNSCRIEALGEQRDWLMSLERQMDELAGEAEQFEQRLTSEQKRLGTTLGVVDHQSLREITPEEVESLQPDLEDLRAARKKLDAASRYLATLTENERSVKSQIDSALVSGEKYQLPMDVQEASDLVARLRRRLQVEQRLEQARSHEVEVEQQCQDLLDDQVMPLSLFGWTLGAVVIGSLLVGVWFLVPNSPLGKFGSWMAIIGLVMSVFSFLFKYFTEDAAAEKLDACYQQLEVLAKQIEDAEREKEKVDAELPMTDGSVVLRMQAAEDHLAELENLLPVEAQRRQAGHEVATAESRVEQAQKQLDTAMTAWRAKLTGLGFSEQLDPQKFLAVVERFDSLKDLRSRTKHRRETLVQRQHEYAAITRRINDVAVEVGCLLQAGNRAETDVTASESLTQLEHLVEQRKRQLADIERREGLFRRAKELKAEEARHRRTVAGLRRRREALFQAADCEDESVYRQLVEKQQETERLRKLRKRISREIAAAIGNHAGEETFAGLLSSERIAHLDASWETASAELESAQEALKTLVDERGSLRQRQRTLAEDRTLAERQLDLSCVEKQLVDAKQTWRQHATVNRVLERIRAHYEANRQPETLAEASITMEKLTGGEYRRVWTPLADDVLLVENSAGESLRVEMLSRGTREQLYLSVRMALVATYARRGINLPMVLDDVLVNFDAVRAQRAAEVLCEFAAGGHQLLLFTCHEHMWQMFKSQDADCRRLPNRQGLSKVEPKPVEDAVPDIEPEPEVEKPKLKKRRKPKAEPVAIEVEPEPLDYFDYPFVERIESDESPVAESSERPLAFILPDEIPRGDRQEDERFGPIERRDHLEPRRA